MTPPAAVARDASGHTQQRDPDAYADRLLKGSLKRSYNPGVDIDWAAPLDPELWCSPEDVKQSETRLVTWSG